MPTTISGTDGVSAVVDGTIVAADIASGAVTPAKLSQPYTLATAQNSTSGTSIDFTGIPSWARRITVMFSGVSTNGSSNSLIQLGAGSVTTTGYTSGSARIATAISNNTAGSASTAGFVISRNGATDVLSGSMQINLVSANTWVSSHALNNSGVSVAISGGGAVSLSGALDRIRITTANGTDTFDAGTINIAYEG